MSDKKIFDNDYVNVFGVIILSLIFAFCLALAVVLSAQGGQG